MSPSAPWHPAQFWPYSVAKSTTSDGRSGFSASVGLPGSESQAASRATIATALIATRVPGTTMPGFATSAGGMLTDQQVAIIADGMISTWGAAGALRNTVLPPYAASAPGDPSAGAQAFARHCAGCHGADGTGGEKGRSVVDGAYLALVTDQALRSAVICGRVDLGMPDWRGGRDGTRLSDQEIGDVVAWLAAKRPPLP